MKSFMNSEMFLSYEIWLVLSELAFSCFQTLSLSSLYMNHHKMQIANCSVVPEIIMPCAYVDIQMPLLHVNLIFLTYIFISPQFFYCTHI